MHIEIWRAFPDLKKEISVIIVERANSLLGEIKTGEPRKTMEVFENSQVYVNTKERD